MRCSCGFFSLPRQYAAGDAHQLEVAQIPGGRDVRPTAQVLPGDRVVAPDVVVDRQLAARRPRPWRPRPRRRGRPLDPDQLELVRLGGQLGARVVVGDHPAAEPLPLLDDLLHLLLELGQVLRGERRGHVEVVVEAVLDRRADAQLRVREQLLHRLREHVRGRVPDDREAVGRLGLHRLDLVTVGDHPGEVAQLTVDPGGDGGAVLTEELGEQLPDRRRLGHTPLSLALDADQMDLDFRHVHSSSSRSAARRPSHRRWYRLRPPAPDAPSTGPPDDAVPDESRGSVS